MPQLSLSHQEAEDALWRQIEPLIYSGDQFHSSLLAGFPSTANILRTMAEISTLFITNRTQWLEFSLLTLIRVHEVFRDLPDPSKVTRRDIRRLNRELQRITNAMASSSKRPQWMQLIAEDEDQKQLEVLRNVLVDTLEAFKERTMAHYVSPSASETSLQPDENETAANEGNDLSVHTYIPGNDFSLTGWMCPRFCRCDLRRILNESSITHPSETFPSLASLTRTFHSKYTSFIEESLVLLKGSDASIVQQFLSAAMHQMLYAKAPDHQVFRCHHLMRRLARASDRLPPDLFLKDVKQTEECPLMAGGFGDVYVGVLGTKIVALKALRYGDHRHATLFAREALMWRYLRHPNILPFLGVSEDAVPSRLCMVSPYMTNGNIVQFLSQNKDADKFELVRQVAEAISYIHSFHLVHSDVKSANVLVNDQKQACLADMGLVSISESQGVETVSSHEGGSVRWMAPELFEPQASPTWLRDVYAFGVTIFEIFTCEIPYAKLPSDPSVILAVSRGHRPVDSECMHPQIPEAVYHIMASCWSLSKDRPTMQQFLSQWGEVQKFANISMDTNEDKPDGGQIDSLSRNVDIAQDSEQVLEEARSKFLAVGDHQGAAKCLKSIGEVRCGEYAYSDARKIMLLAVKEFEQIMDHRGMAQCLWNYGEILEMENNDEDAQEAFQRAMSEFRFVDDKLGVAQCLQSLGDIFRVKNNHKDAKDALTHAMEQFKRLGDRCATAQCLHSLGEILRMERNHHDARDIFTKAINEFKFIGDRRGTAQCLHSLGDILRKECSYEGARDALTRAQNQFNIIGDRSGAAQCLQSLGEILRAEHKSQDAQDTLAQAMHEFRNISDRLGAGQCLQSLGSIARHREDYHAARAYFSAAIVEFESVSNSGQASACWRKLNSLPRELSPKNWYPEDDLIDLTTSESRDRSPEIKNT